MCGRLDDEPSGDFGVGHVGDHRLEVGAGLGLLDGLGTIEVGDILKASNETLLGGRLEVLSLLDGITADFSDDAGNLLLVHFSVCQRVHMVGDE